MAFNHCCEFTQRLENIQASLQFFSASARNCYSVNDDRDFRRVDNTLAPSGFTRDANAIDLHPRTPRFCGRMTC